ncbi:MAG: hypothetical protein HY769_09835 [Candidatus Stahlbacteria bacterium]|nr:hypothetical protein [Candidatus Stahlbacteria bacterium]
MMYKVLLVICVAVMGCQQDKGSIAGKVTKAGVGQKNAIVLAITGDSLTSGQNINPDNLKGTIVLSNDGSYKILLVDAGNYVVAAINDKNSNHTFEDSVDEIGYFGHKDTLTNLTIPDKVTLEKGENKTGVNIDTLYVLPH